jgi:hypothetical protein
MAAVTLLTLSVHTDDGTSVQTCWGPIDADVVERIRGLLGEPVCEVLMDGTVMAAVEQAGDAAGAVVMFADEP